MILSPDLASFYKKKLYSKIVMIQDTIDIHMHSLGIANIYLEKSYIYKLAVLEANEKRLREHTTSLKMSDQMQSYNIYDSEEFY